jgi:hypothetical protein
MQRNKVYSVTVIAAVAQQLGVDEELLHDISIGLEPEDRKKPFPLFGVAGSEWPGPAGIAV